MVKQIYKYGVLNYPDEVNRKKFFCLKKELDWYQEYINENVKKYGKSNSLILDIGANVGIFTVSFAKLYPESTIHSFECVPTTKEYLEMNVKENNLKNVVVHNFGLSNKNEEVEITYNKDNIGNASIKQSPKKNEIRLKIKTRRLDELNLSNISFIKVDIQDHEYEFILGAEQTLRNNKPFVILELTNKTPEEKLLYKKCIVFMSNLGYTNKIQLSRKDWGFFK